MEYNKQEAILIAIEFMDEVNKLEKKYNMSFSSDTGDIYLQYKTNEKIFRVWDTIDLGWIDGQKGLKVIENHNNDDKIREIALSKLSDKEKEVLGLM